jgi:hypothetical protein
VQHSKGEGVVASSKIANMTYMNYLVRFQKWLERGSAGNVLDDNLSDNTSNASLDDDEDEDKPKNDNLATPNGD